MQFVIDLGLSLLYFGIFLVMCAWVWKFWKMHGNQKHLNSINEKMILLEIKLPREILKSPLATEHAISCLLVNSGVSTWYKRDYIGALPTYASLEIASIEGVIHFYVRAEKKLREAIEANFYSQYPGIEIVEASDYTKLIRYHHLTNDVSMWGTAFKLGQTFIPENKETGEMYKDEKGKDYKMPADFLPMKTYVDYELDKDPKEEFKIDPITLLLETMGSMGKGEHMWYQVILNDEAVYVDGKMGKYYVNKTTHEHFSIKELADHRKFLLRKSGYKKKGAKEIDDFGVAKMINGPGKTEDGKPIPIEGTYVETKAVMKKESELSLEDKEEIEAINKKLSKHLVAGLVRLVYISKRDKFRPSFVTNVLQFPRPYKGGTNFLKPSSLTDPYDYNWENWLGRPVAWRTEEMFEEYVEREGLFPHIPERKSLTSWEDTAFWTSSLRTRKLFRLVYEIIFHPFEHPAPKDVSIYNLEEIATLWHLPGAVATTPTIPRIDSVKGVAPSNLPM
jgi:hypothetical protein